MLYNGDAPWNVSETVEALIEPSIPEKFIPHLSYYPLIINAIPTEQLERIQNAVSAVFFVENSSPADLIDHLDRIVDILKDEAPEALTRFGNWFSNFLETTGGFDAPEFAEITTVSEVRTMFATKLEAYRKQLIEEGREEGLEEGLEEGREEGLMQGREQTRRETAIRLLRRGDTPEDVVEITGLSLGTVNELQKTEL